MTTVFPSAIDSLPRPGAATYMDDSGFEGDVVIDNISDAIEAVEAAVGSTAAADTLLDYVRLHDGVNKGLFVPSSALVGLSPFVNGGFDIWQDGATFTSIANSIWGPDNWIYRKVSAGVHDLLRSTDVPTVAQSQRVKYSLQLDVTTVDTSIAASDFVTIGTRIEGYRWRRFDQKIWSIRFWVKAAKTGAHYVAARNTGEDRSCVIAYTINAADTWEEKQVTFPANPAAGTWDYDNGRGIEIAWCLMAGSNYQVAAGAWQTNGLGLCASDQVNELDNVANNFRIAMVGRPTLGANAAPYVSTDYDLELLRCNRYYNKSYEPDTAPGTASPTGELIGQASAAVAASTAGNILLLGGVPRFPVPMRATPTVTIYSSSGGTANAALIAGSTNRTGGTAGLPDMVHPFAYLAFDNSSATAIADRGQIQVHYKAVARLP